MSSDIEKNGKKQVIRQHCLNIYIEMYVQANEVVDFTFILKLYKILHQQM